MSILTVGAIVIIFLVKVFPHMTKLSTSIAKSDDDLKALLAKVISSDEQQSIAIADLRTANRNVALDILRLTVYNEAVPIEDRFVAARRYFIMGGNGKVAHFIKPLTETNQAAWAAIVAMSSEDEKKTLNKALTGV
jgi:hypothetical protein